MPPQDILATIPLYTDHPSEAELFELRAMELVDAGGSPRRFVPEKIAPHHVARSPIEAPGVLNEAYDYGLPSSFTRGLCTRIEAGTTILWISGTSAVDEHGASVHVGDFRAQLLRTFHNIGELLTSEGANWHDVVRTTCYIRDIERDYDEFNKVRTWFYTVQGLDPVPASTAIQARICRSDLLIEIEGFAMKLDRPCACREDDRP